MPEQFSRINLSLLLALTACLLFFPTPVHAVEPPISPGDQFAGWSVEAMGQQFTAMDFAAPNDGWAISHRMYSRYQHQSNLYRFDGARWRWQQTFQEMELWDVSAISSTDGWLLGNSYDKNGYDISHLFHYDGDAWQPVTGPADVLYGIEMLSAQEGYISGEKFLWRYDGTSWTTIGNSPPNAWITRQNNHFQVLDGQNIWLSDESSTISANPDDLNGNVYRFSNGAWQPTLPHTTISSLSVVSPTLGWAGGPEGAIWRYDGSTWSSFTPVPNPYPMPTVYRVEGIAALADKPQEVWAVIPKGVYHFDGVAWRAQPMPLLPSSLLMMLSRGNGWLGPATHYTGAEWKSSSSLVAPAVFPTMESVEADVFALNRNSVWYANHMFDGRKWQTIPYSISDQLIAPFVDQPASFVSREGQLNKIKIFDTTNGWAIGDLLLTTADYQQTKLSGFLFHYAGDVWTAIAAPDSKVDDYFAGLSDLAITDRSTAWVLGNNSAIHRYADQQWQTLHPAREPGSAAPYLSALDMLSSTDGWAAGNAFLHYDGQAWQVTQPISDSISAIDMVSGGDGWAVGERGTIYGFDGQAWQKALSPTTIDLSDIAMPSSADGWSVGYDWGQASGYAASVLLHYDGSAWQTAATLPQSRIWSISMPDAKNGWIAGSEELLLRLGTADPVSLFLYLPGIFR